MKRKVLFIASTGGHLSEMLMLKEMFSKYDYHIITENTKSDQYLKKVYPGKVNYLIYGTKDHPLTYPFKLLANCFKSLYFYFRIHPDYIITTGAHTAGPMCCIGKILGSKIIYIESCQCPLAIILLSRSSNPIINICNIFLCISWIHCFVF